MQTKHNSELLCPNLKDSADQIRSVGSWTFHENLLYVVFLQRNKVIMQSKRKRRNERVFDRMSQFIVTRTSLQCRSHHQKFLEKLGDIKTIIQNFKKYLTKEEFRQRYLQALARKKEVPKDKNQTTINSNIKLQEEIQSNDMLEGSQDPSPKPSENELPTVKSQSPSPTATNKQDEMKQNEQEREDSGSRGEVLAGNGQRMTPIIPQFVNLAGNFGEMSMMMNRGYLNYPFMNPFFYQSMMPFF